MNKVKLWLPSVLVTSVLSSMRVREISVFYQFALYEMVLLLSCHV